MSKSVGNRRGRTLGALVAAAALAACDSGGSSGSPSWWVQAGPGTDVPPSAAEAARFLVQATYGPTEEEIDALSYAGYDAWFEHQLGLAPTLHRPPLSAKVANGKNVSKNHRMERWWKASIEGEDQLRQRVAFALSEIFVISDVAGALDGDPVGVAEYYDILVRGAFGNWRDLLEDVTLSPAMGVYLSMLKNEKPDLVLNIRPDENYAREVLQLFSIGLAQLGPDGVPLTVAGQPIPTYDQAVVEGFAHVFTGWNYAGATSWQWPQKNYLPMENWPAYHDTAPKVLLDGAAVPGGQTGEADLAQALDVIFQHQNVAPFVSRALIQRLVTSNPTPAYVGRVAAVFADDGAGVRGNLGAVVKAILTDPEARTGHTTMPDTFGKLREPLLRQTALWRVLRARPSSGKYETWNPQSDFNQAPLRAPSVFNFFHPDYAPPGEVTQLGLVAPEFQITTHNYVTRTTNRLYDLVFTYWKGSGSGNSGTARIDISGLRKLAADPVALTDEVDLLLASGGLSGATKSTIVGHVGSVAMDYGSGPDGTQRVLEAIWLVITSPEGAVQR